MKKKQKDQAVEQIRQQIKKPAKEPIKLKGNLPTGVTLIDLVIGGGFPYGFVNIIGDSSSGKSFLSGEIIATAFHKLGKDRFDWFYDDAEKGYKFNSEKLYGMDIIGGGFLPPKRRSNTIEDFERNIQEIIDKKDPRKRFIYVLDSFDSITSDDEIKFKNKKLKASVSGDDDGESAGSYGLSKQKESHSFFRTKIRELEEHKIVLIIVSQVKEKINVSFGKKLYRTGGKSLDFYPNVVFWLAEVEKYRKKDRPVGICSKVQATKSRNDKPFRECLVDMVFDYGIDNVASNINFLFDLKTDGNRDKKKLNCLWNKKEYTREELIKHIEKNNLEEELAEKVIEKWNAIEDSISSSGRKSRWS